MCFFCLREPCPGGGQSLLRGLQVQVLLSDLLLDAAQTLLQICLGFVTQGLRFRDLCADSAAIKYLQADGGHKRNPCRLDRGFLENGLVVR